MIFPTGVLTPWDEGINEDKTKSDQLPGRKGSKEAHRVISLVVPLFIMSPLSRQAFERAQARTLEPLYCHEQCREWMCVGGLPSCTEGKDSLWKEE